MTAVLACPSTARAGDVAPNDATPAMTGMPAKQLRDQQLRWRTVSYRFARRSSSAAGGSAKFGVEINSRELNDKPRLVKSLVVRRLLQSP
jgi:hypothetical protein